MNHNNLLENAATAWTSLCATEYIIVAARKGKKHEIVLRFAPEDFPHLAGMQYAKDVDFGLNRAEFYGAKLLTALSSGSLDGTLIEKSQRWDKIQGRLNAIVNLQETLDGDFDISTFDKLRVAGYCRIDAKYIIKNKSGDAVYFVFLDSKNGYYYCRSAFEFDEVDYMLNQQKLKILSKSKNPQL